MEIRKILAGMLLSALFLCVRAQALPSSGYLLPDSSVTYLPEERVADMPPQVLCYARNEIYARNGRMFESEELQNYFLMQYWYTPLYTPEQFSADILNVYETANVEMIAQAETAAGGYLTDQPGYSYGPVWDYLEQSASPDLYEADPDSWIFYDSDQRLLVEDELAMLTLQELCYARNEIYARRGRLFASRELQDYFDQKNWYFGSIPPEQFTDELLSETEQANVRLLYEAEHARSSEGYLLDEEYSYAGIGSYAGYYTYGKEQDEYIFWDSSIRHLTEEETSQLSLQELCYARNEIYARRGYIFRSRELREYFGGKSWYYGTIPASEFSETTLNECEVYNIELLKRCEYGINPNGYPLQ